MCHSINLHITTWNPVLYKMHVINMVGRLLRNFEILIGTEQCYSDMALYQN